MAKSNTRQPAQANLAALVVAFWLAFLLAIAAFSAYKTYPTLSRDGGDDNKIKPIYVTLNKPIDGYQFADRANLTIIAQSKCYVYLYGEREPNNFVRIFPNIPDGHKDFESSFYTLSPGESRVVDMLGNSQMRVSCVPMKLHLIALNCEEKPLTIGPSYAKDTDMQEKFMDTSAEVNQARALQKANPGQVLEFVFDGPVASKESYNKYMQQQKQKPTDGAAQQTN